VQHFQDQVNNALTWAQRFQTVANIVGGLLSTGAGRASDAGAPPALSGDQVTGGQSLNGAGAGLTPAIFDAFRSYFNSYFPKKK
jgi:hypothetical protein